MIRGPVTARCATLALQCALALAPALAFGQSGEPLTRARADIDFIASIAREEAVVVSIAATRDAPVRSRLLPPDDPDDLEPLPVVRHDVRAHARQADSERQLASGVIASNDGEILTNAHAVAGATRLEVRLADGRRFEGRVLGYDRTTDIALIRIDAHDLPAAVLGRSANLVRGEWVVAIGSPFGLDNSATAGIVSAARRVLPGTAVPLIQSDAAINPGSSGGPLFNLKGEVVGINSMIFSATGGFMGVSFSVPIDVAVQVAAELRTSGRVARGHLGARVQDVTPELARSFGLAAPVGVVVLRTRQASAAERAGLRSGDVILGTGTATDATPEQLQQDVAAAHAGQRLALNVWRGGRVQRLEVTVEAQPAETPAPTAHSSRPPDPRLGLNLGDMPASRRERLGIEAGLPVLEARGAASRAGIRADDVVVAVGERPIREIAEFDAALAAAPAGRPVPLLVLRDNTLAYMAIDPGS